MKICLIGPAYPYRGGIAHFTSMLAREFGREHEVSIINFTRLYPSFLFPGKTQFDDSESALRVESERIIDCLNPLTWLRAGRAAADRDPELVVFQWWQPFFGPAYRTVCSTLKRRCGATVVYLCHNVLPHESSAVDRLLIDVGFARVDAFLVQSTEDEKNLARIRKNVPTVVNPHPIYDFFDGRRYDGNSAREKLGLEGPVILFFGYVREYKGLGVLIEAFARIVDRMPATLLVVGEFYDNRKPYDDLIEKCSIGGQVRVVDEYVPNAEVELYFKAADLVALPYLSATQSGIVQTAYSFDKPVVVTAVGGLPDVVQDGVTGYVVPRADSEALADAVVRFFESGSAERMANNIRADRDRFSWKHCAEALLSLRNEVVDDVEKL